MKRYTKIVLITWGVMALAGGMYMLVKGQEDPREKVLGEWEEKSSKVRVEVVPGEVRWRGVGGEEFKGTGGSRARRDKMEGDGARESEI